MRQGRSGTVIDGEEALAILLGFVDLQSLEELEYVNSYGLGALVDDFARNDDRIRDQMRACLGAFSAELNRGKKSMLTVDYALSKGGDISITLESFRAWAIDKVLPARLPRGVHSTVLDPSPVSVVASTEPAASEAVPPEVAKTKQQRTKKSVQQADAILAEIHRQGFDPNSLPKNPAGKGDIKMQVRDAIAKPPLFPSHDAFDKRWQVLRGQKLIIDKVDPPPPK